MKHKRFSVNQYYQGILDRNRMILGKAITLVESNLAADKILAAELLEKLLPASGNSLRIGITGVPGVGKSTFINTFGLYLVENGHQIAVLAVDPTSSISQGSIMGDKTRMEDLSTHPKAFIRPSPAGNSLGGVANKTRETILLCESFGFDIVIVETVGVGQSDIAVHSMVDFFLLLLLTNAGDELQGIKRGIMEMAHSIILTKADGENASRAEVERVKYKMAAELFTTHSCWKPVVNICSAIENKGIKEIWETVNQYQKTMKENGLFKQKRQQQDVNWLHDIIIEKLKYNFYQYPPIANKIKVVEKEIIQGKIIPTRAAELLLEEQVVK